MGEFFAAIVSPNVPFIRYALIAGILAAPAFGVVGSYVVVNRISYLAGAIAHSVLAGIGLSLFLRSRFGPSWFTPFWGAFAAAMVSALLVALATKSGRQRADSAISIVWALGTAIGVIFLTRTSGFVDPMAYLFGNILLLSAADLVGIVVLDIVVLAVALLFYPQLFALSFDQEFAEVRGMPTQAHLTILLLLTGATVVLLVSTVGIVLVITLLTLPAATAGFFARSLKRLMIVASILSAFFAVAGIGVSYAYDLPSGAGIVLFTVTGYIVAFVITKITAKNVGRRPTNEKTESRSLSI
ncbi:MAG: metal ABC transporter permease [Spirochaetaceae bacterium]|nr:MAG: metal ABC transporter permease [Spirochaetaceae bacterium]